MKLINSILAVSTIAVAGALGACSGNSAETEALAQQAERINTELETLAADSPEFLSDAKCSFAETTLSVDVELADTTIKATAVSQPLAEFVVSMWLKNHATKNLEIVLNSLGKVKGNMLLTLTDFAGEKSTYDISAQRLKKLFTGKPSELGFSEAKANVLDILDTRCAAYAATYRARECTFQLLGGFAQYSLVFASKNAYGNLTQDSLRGRYLKQLKAIYASFGACAPIMQQLLSELGIDGYRFVYETPDSPADELRAAIPWKMII